MNIKYKEVDYKNFGRCLVIDNSHVELIVTLDIGPRVISYRLIDGTNVFWEDIDRELFVNNEETDNIFYKGSTWYGLGGHRLWRAPETYATYYSEEFPVKYLIKDNSFIFEQIKQDVNEVKLIIQLTFLSKNQVEFTGSIINESNKPKKMSAWSISMCKGPGLEIIELPKDKTNFYPQRYYSFWDFGAKYNDPRAFYGNDYFALKMVPGNLDAYKVGIRVKPGKALYLEGNNAFVKTFYRDDSKTYPDNNVNYETYTKNLFLEIETLSPLEDVLPNDRVSVKEIWSLYKLSDKIPNDIKEDNLSYLFNKYAK